MVRTSIMVYQCPTVRLSVRPSVSHVMLLANSLQISQSYWNIKKYTDHKTINSNNCAKFEVNWPKGSQFTVRHTKIRLQFDE
jgi:hypothetical protein